MKWRTRKRDSWLNDGGDKNPAKDNFSLRFQESGNQWSDNEKMLQAWQ
jgi:hypothetical protein